MSRRWLWGTPRAPRQNPAGLLRGRPREPVRALPGGLVGVRVRSEAGLGDDGLHGYSSSLVVVWSRVAEVLEHLGDPPGFQALWRLRR